MTPDEKSVLLKEAKKLLLDIVMGKEAPRQRDEYLFWWLTNLKFLSPELYVPVQATKAVHQRAEAMTQKLARYLRQLLDSPRHRWTYAKGLILSEEQKQKQLRLEAIIDKINQDKPSIQPPESIFSNEKPKPETYIIPIYVQLPSKDLTLDICKLASNIKSAFSPEIITTLKENLRKETYISDRIDVGLVTLKFPDNSALISNKETKLRELIFKKFGKHSNEYILEQKDNVWYLTLFKYRLEKDIVYVIEYKDEKYEFRELINLPSKLTKKTK